MHYSITRQALWQVIEKCGVPPSMLRIAKSFHDGMRAEVRVGALISSSFEVRNGLRQMYTSSYLL